MGIPKSVSGIEEIHEISKRLEEEYYQKKKERVTPVPKSEERIRALEGQVAELHKQHKNLLEHVAHLARFVADQIKESSEKE